MSEKVLVQEGEKKRKQAAIDNNNDDQSEGVELKTIIDNNNITGIEKKKKLKTIEDELNNAKWISTPISFDINLLKHIYNHFILEELLNVKSNCFSILENNYFFEHFLWNNFKEETCKERELIFSIIILLNEKLLNNSSKYNLKEIINSEKFKLFFNNVVNLKCENIKEKLIILIFIMNCFNNIDLFSKYCLEYVSIPLWKHLNPKIREIELTQRDLNKYWKNLLKKEKKGKTNNLTSDFIPNLIKDFLEILNKLNQNENNEMIIYCERFLEFLIDLLGQLSTRRFFRIYLENTHLLEKCKLSKFITSSKAFKLNQLINYLHFYLMFDINDETGEALSITDALGNHAKQLSKLQQVVFQLFPIKLKPLTLSNISKIESRESLDEWLSILDKSELIKLCQELLLIDTNYNNNDNMEEEEEVELLKELIITKYEKRPSLIDRINNTSLYPTEKTIWEEIATIENISNPNITYTGIENIALPKLGLQFLTLYDYLLRNFTLFRLEKTFSIRRSIEEAIIKMKGIAHPTGLTQFLGKSRNAIPLEKPFEIIEVTAPKLGESTPSKVEGVISISLADLNEDLKREWNSVKKNDILFLVHLKSPITTIDEEIVDLSSKSFIQRYGIVSVRGCEVIRHEDEDGNIINSQIKLAEQDESLEYEIISLERRLVVLLDPVQYVKDRKEEETSYDRYSNFNLLIRLKPKDNNFKAVLETIRDLMNYGCDHLPSWLHDYILGYEPTTNKEEDEGNNADMVIDFRDTFIDENHLRSTLPIPNELSIIYPKHHDKSQRIKQYYYNISYEHQTEDNNNNTITSIRAYIPRRIPYSASIIGESNNIYSFNKSQVNAIKSCISPKGGLIMIETPPSSGKYQMLQKVIENLYFNYPKERIIYISRSNLSLNNIFELISKNTNIHNRHLLRLGGENSEYSKFGRLNYLLQLRLDTLKMIDLLASSLQLLQFTNLSCETATHFFIGYIIPKWKEFITQCKHYKRSTKELNVDFIESHFPFNDFFKIQQEKYQQQEGFEEGEGNNNFSIFKKQTFDEDLLIAFEKYSEIELLYELLNECKVLESIRSYSERTNYILTQQSRIIAMTSTHAAIKRRSFLQQNLQFDTLILEDASQILEIESFIPMTLTSRLKRVICVGDVYQLPPMIKNKQIERFSNMNQSLFARLFRSLDEKDILTLSYDSLQTFTELIPLFKWNYPSTFYESVLLSSEDKKVSPPNGFEFNCQFINVEDYQGVGESEPVPHFYQNLGEAEYVVAVYMFLRLIGYPSEKITILTTYQGQKRLIRNVIEERCKLFGPPKKVTTVDRYQGQQNDIILLSLVRTIHPGHLNDKRRVATALSSANKGIYIFGRLNMFISKCPALANIIQQQNTPRDLYIHPEDRYNEQLVREERKPTIVKDVIEMGQLVYKLAMEKLIKK
ncbi:hypothetical protein ABK040_010146 [Willaertia magna]